MSEKTFRFVVKRLLVAHVEQRFVIGLPYFADPVRIRPRWNEITAKAT
jgi:hypothetical protein